MRRKMGKKSVKNKGGNGKMGKHRVEKKVKNREKG